MMISGIMGAYGAGNYRISSIYGNPYSMNAIQRIGKDPARAGRPLIVARKEPEEEPLYVKDFGKLDNTKSTATGSFAEMLSAQEKELTAVKNDNYSDYLNDTIGVMGNRNRLREQLLGTGFTSFA